MDNEEIIDRLKHRRKIAAIALLYAILIWTAAGIYTQIGRRTSADVQLPLSDVGHMAVDSSGSIYCDLRSFQRIQVYDQNGKFIKAAQYEGQLIRMESTEDMGLAVTTVRNERTYFYFLHEQGRLVEGGSTKLHSSHHAESPIRRFTSPSGVDYVVKGHSAGRVVRTDPSGERYIIVSVPFLLVLAEPRLVWLVGLLGVAGVAYTSKRLHDLREPEPEDPDSLDNTQYEGV